MRPITMPHRPANGPQRREEAPARRWVAALAAAAVIGSLSACATSSGVPRAWVAVHAQDPFTDQMTCRVSPPDLPISGLFATQLVYYPFVEKRGGSVRVGLIAGGRFKIPTGRVRLRVDDMPAWTIETSETPLDMVAPATTTTPGYGSGQPKAVAEAIARASQAASTSVSQAISPFTAATGQKAQAMLAQMRVGHEIIYETLGVNQPASHVGQQPLGADFVAALADCGL